MSEIEIRPACRNDLAGLRDLFMEEGQFHANLVPDFVVVSSEVLTTAELDKFITDKTYSLIVADDANNGLVGAVLASVLSYGDEAWLRQRQVAYVDELIVSAKHRQRGIAKRLMKSVNRWASDQALLEIELHVWASNTRAVAFYEAFGFEITRHTLRTQVKDNNRE